MGHLWDLWVTRGHVISHDELSMPWPRPMAQGADLAAFTRMRRVGTQIASQESSREILGRKCVPLNPIF